MREGITLAEAFKHFADGEDIYAIMDCADSLVRERMFDIFCEMTGDLDIVVSLLNSMNADESGAIIAAISDIDSVFAAKVTKKLMP